MVAPYPAIKQFMNDNYNTVIKKIKKGKMYRYSKRPKYPRESEK
jgi:hypothetical protein